VAVGLAQASTSEHPPGEPRMPQILGVWEHADGGLALAELAATRISHFPSVNAGSELVDEAEDVALGVPERLAVAYASTSQLSRLVRRSSRSFRFAPWPSPAASWRSRASTLLRSVARVWPEFRTKPWRPGPPRPPRQGDRRVLIARSPVTASARLMAGRWGGSETMPW
jgi:hypothetical protein